MFENAPVIHTHTRADALADGTLVDATATAREAGVKFPVALTRAVWNASVKVPAKVECQDEAGRLWDVLWMPRTAIARTAGSEVRFSLAPPPASGWSLVHRVRIL
jgi:hypothetical protein